MCILDVPSPASSFNTQIYEIPKGFRVNWLAIHLAKRGMLSLSLIFTQDGFGD
jgi:hypothetical protein